MRGEVRVVGAERPGGLELRTAGLAARGLPEVRVTGLPPYLGQGWARVLGAVAARVAAAGPVLPVLVEMADGVELRLVPEKDGTLAVVPPPPPPTDVGQWRRDVVARLFPEAAS
ncbi:hypothetical protein BTM25_36620 [Actinomadura rubteroloni]|uniref:Uncharacterized protein n=1 Tax=Actinomadura rubteroloni TaxID=1926885 RepID=A0A2P4UJ25_9ACTN|nr:hypothetical protein [Actinomadura rubteroloni]POM25021.1 hypothetical protein BTM25_36620 [Actinomadura rubteroloni]